MATLDSNPFVAKVDDQLVITPEGYAYLDQVLTDSHGRVYVFNNKIPPVMVAAAMARLSRRAGDMRLTILDEFAQTGEEDANALIQRVVTGFGDDSVQQLTGIHVVVEGASNLMTKMLERGRFMGALEQSSRYIYFDQKDAEGHYAYLRLDYLPEPLRSEYVTTMDQIFNLYSKMVREITTYVQSTQPLMEGESKVAWRNATRAAACDGVRAVLPVATRSTVGLFGSSQALEALIIRLMSEELPEAQEIGQSLLEQARQVIPAFLERTDKPDRGLATAAYRATRRQQLQKLVKDWVGPETKPPQEATVRLVDYWPKQEQDLLVNILFAHSHRAKAELQKIVAKLSESQKQEIIKVYLGERLNRRHKPGRAVEKAHFEWEIVDEYATFRDIQRHRVVDDMEWQTLTPEYGYSVPELVTKAGYESDFRRCFELSEGLYTKMVNGGFRLDAQYATLFGHRLRYSFIMNLRQLYHFLELRTSPTGHPGYRKICQQIYAQLPHSYQQFINGMTFLNQGENEELGRLAAEKATQFKLSQLGASPDLEQ